MPKVSVIMPVYNAEKYAGEENIILLLGSLYLKGKRKQRK